MHCIEMIIFFYILKINPVNIRYYTNRCVSLSRKRLAVHVLGRGGGKYALPHRIEFDPLFPPPTGFGNNEEEENFRVEGIFDTSVFLGIYMERAHVNLL